MVKRQDSAAAQQSQNSFLVDLTRLTKTITEEGTELQVTGIAGGSLDVTGTVTIEPGANPIDVTGTVTVSGGSITVDEPVSVDDDGGSLTVDAPDAAPLPMAVTEDGTDTLVKVGDDANKAVRVNIVAGAGSGGTAATDESAYTPTTSLGTPIMGAVDDTGTDSAAEDTLALIRSTPTRALHVNLRDNAGAELSVGGGTQYTEDAPAAANPVGNVTILVANDTPAAEVAVGDNVAQRGTEFGAAYCQILDSAGAFVDSFGGGTQYTEGTTDATITGTAALAEGPADALTPLLVDASQFLQVDIAATSVTQPISAVSLPLPTGAATSALQTQPGVDIGDVTVNNAAGGAAVNIQDGGNSITVDGTVNAVLAEPISVDDNGGSITVDGTVSISGAVDTELTTADLDEGAGTSTHAIVGLALAGDGGPFLVGESNALPVTGAVNASITGPVTADPSPVLGTNHFNTAASVTSVNVLVANPGRIMAMFTNDSTSICYLKLGTGASTTSYTIRLRGGDYYELPCRYVDDVEVIWVSATGDMRVTECEI